MNVSYIQQFFSLDGRTAVITGASSGIGQATAIALANFGAEAILIGRDISRLKETEAEITRAQGKCHSYIVDISKKDEIDRFFDAYRKTHGKLDIFVSNAACNIRTDAINTTEEAFDTLMNTNFKGAWLCLQHAGRIMQEQRGGNIVVVSSINGISPLADQAIYSTTKAALLSLTQSLASTLAPYCVRVNCCAPGCILTNLNKEIFSDKAIHDDKVKKIPVGHLGRAMEIGNVIATVVSDAYSFMTGATMVVDGGESLRPKTYLGDA